MFFYYDSFCKDINYLIYCQIPPCGDVRVLRMIVNSHRRLFVAVMTFKFDDHYHNLIIINIIYNPVVSAYMT